jgi:Histidine kinase-like ATPase domain
MIIPAGMTVAPRTAWPLSCSMPPMAALVTAPGTARAYLASVLANWNLASLTGDGQAVVSELVSNAVEASTIAGRPVYLGGRIAVVRLALLSDGSRLVTEVYDQAPGQPVIREPTSDSEAGRGLLVITQLTRGRWGWSPLHGQPGKVVWAELATESAPGPAARAAGQLCRP